MRILVLLLLVLPPSLRAQLASSAGGTLYLLSTLVPRGSNLPQDMRLLRYSPDGFQVEATLQLDPLVDVFGNLEASSDGSVVSYWSLRHPLAPNPWCSGDCYYPISYSGNVIMGGEVQSFGRGVSLSRNGRYAVLFDDSPRPPERIDLTTGERSLAPAGLLAASRQAITSDGHLLLTHYQGNGATRLILWSPASQSDIATVTISGEPGFTSPTALISDDATRVVWNSPADYTLHAIDVSTGSDRVIARAPGLISQVSISDTGDFAAFVAPSGPGLPLRLHLASADGSGDRVFAGAPEGISEAALQTDGTALYALTSSGRMLRIDTVSFDAIDLWKPPALPYVLGTSTLRVSPGSYQRITGQVLTADVRIGDTALQVLSATAQELQVQVPFEAAETTGSLRVASDSPLEQPFPAEIRALSPRFLSFWDLAIETPPYLAPFAAIGHGDSSGYVKMDSPAHLGEVVNLYMTGLGPVTPSVATGAPSPSSPPALVTAGIHATTLKQDLH